MSQKGEKYARGVEKSLGGLSEGLSGLEEHLERLETAQAAQGDLIRVVLGARTAAEETAKRRIHCVRQRAAEAEQRARLWRGIALGAVVTLLVVCLAVILTAPVEAETPPGGGARAHEGSGACADGCDPCRHGAGGRAGAAQRNPRLHRELLLL